MQQVMVVHMAMSTLLFGSQTLRTLALAGCRCGSDAMRLPVEAFDTYCRTIRFFLSEKWRRIYTCDYAINSWGGVLSVGVYLD